jgi:hypothetical protein
MSDAPQVRRANRLMPAERARSARAGRGYYGRLGTVGADRWPTCCRSLYVWLDGELWVRNTSARGHLRANVEHELRVCFEVDEPGEVFPYNRFEVRQLRELRERRLRPHPDRGGTRPEGARLRRTPPIPGSSGPRASCRVWAKSRSTPSPSSGLRARRRLFLRRHSDGRRSIGPRRPALDPLRADPGHRVVAFSNPVV